MCRLPVPLSKAVDSSGMAGGLSKLGLIKVVNASVVDDSSVVGTWTVN